MVDVGATAGRLDLVEEKVRATAVFDGEFVDDFLTLEDSPEIVGRLRYEENRRAVVFRGQDRREFALFCSTRTLLRCGFCAGGLVLDRFGFLLLRLGDRGSYGVLSRQW